VTAPNQLPADLAGALLWTDEYGTIWKGTPGEHGSVVVGDAHFADDECEWPLTWLDPRDRRVVG